MVRRATSRFMGLKFIKLENPVSKRIQNCRYKINYGHWKELVLVTRINNFICFFFSMRTGVRHSPLGAARITLGRSTTCARRKQRENLCSSWAQVNPKYEVVHARVLGRTGGGV